MSPHTVTDTNPPGNERPSQGSTQEVPVFILCVGLNGWPDELRHKLLAQVWYDHLQDRTLLIVSEEHGDPGGWEKDQASNCGRDQFITIIIYPLTARVAGAPQMILQPVPSIFPCSPLTSGTWRTPGLSIP